MYKKRLCTPKLAIMNQPDMKCFLSSDTIQFETKGRIGSSKSNHPHLNLASKNGGRTCQIKASLGNDVKPIKV